MKFRRITAIIVNGIVATAAELARHPGGGCDVTDETAPLAAALDELVIRIERIEKKVGLPVA